MNTEIAHAAAYTREQRIDHLINDAVRRAVKLDAEGRFGRAEYELTRCALALAKLEGDTATVHALEDLVYVEVGA